MRDQHIIPTDKLPTFTSFRVTAALRVNGVQGGFSEESHRMVRYSTSQYYGGCSVCVKPLRDVWWCEGCIVWDGVLWDVWWCEGCIVWDGVLWDVWIV